MTPSERPERREAPILVRPSVAAMMLGMSVSWLRASSVPKTVIEPSEPGGRETIRYAVADLEAWARARSTMRQSA